MTTRKGTRKPRKTRRSLRTETDVILYPGTVILRVGKSVREEREKENSTLGEFERQGNGDWYGLCCWDGGGNFGVFFNYRLDHGIIAHELFHLTSHILQFAEVRFDCHNHEAFTYLNQYLTNWTYERLAKAKIKISL